MITHDVTKLDARRPAKDLLLPDVFFGFFHPGIFLCICGFWYDYALIAPKTTQLLGLEGSTPFG